MKCSRDRKEAFYQYKTVFITGWLLIFIVDLFLLLYASVLLIEANFSFALLETEWKQCILYGLLLLFLLLGIAIIYRYIILRKYDKARETQLLWKIEQEYLYNLLLQQKIVAMEAEQAQFGEQIQNISRMIQRGEEGEIEQYLGQITKKDNKVILQKLTGNLFLNVLLSEKWYKAEQNAVQFQIDYQPNIQMEQLSEYDSCILLGNLLDNAIEAAAKSEERFVLCELQRKNSYWNSIIVQNSCDVSPAFKQGLPVTQHAEEEHGYGTRIIQRKVQQYQGKCSFSYDEKQKVFTVSILLPVHNL